MVNKVKIVEIKKKLLALLGRREVLIGLSIVVMALLGLAVGSLIGHLRQQVAAPTASPTVASTATERATLPPTSTPAFDFTPTPAPTDAEPDTPTPTPTSPAPPADAPPTHTVAAGETLGGIALQYGVSVEALMAENGLASGDFIQEGQELTIPISEAVPTATPRPQGVRTHIVEAGDVLGQIAVQYDVSIEALMEANDLGRPIRLWRAKSL